MKTYDKNNKIIAQFLGLTIITDGISLFDTKYKPLAKYHENWNDLMPVVEKIESLEGWVQIDGLSNRKLATIRVGDMWEKSFLGESDSKIEATYKAVVEFIKWYNNEKIN